MTTETDFTLHVSPEAEDGVVRLDPADMRFLVALPGDILALTGARTCYARVFPAFMGERNQRLASVSPLLQRNLGVQPGNKIQISGKRAKPLVAESVTLEVEDDLDQLHLVAREGHLSVCWHELPVAAGDCLRVSSLDRNQLFAKAVATMPDGLVQIVSGTRFTVTASKKNDGLPGLSGLRDVYRTCQSLAQARLKTRLAHAARSVLLTGPSGCGKVRLVTRLASEMGMPVFTFDMHQMIDMHLAQNSREAHVSLTDFARKGPAILLLDHLEVLTPAGRDSAFLDVAARAALSQVLGLLEEVPAHPELMVFGIGSGPLDGRFRDRPCFDLVLPVDAPNRLERQEILTLATRNMPLAEPADLALLAARTPGTTARDLFQLVTTASHLAQGAKLTDKDFISALRNIEPSASAEVRCDIPDVSWHDVAGL
ncbi:MAG: AAA family ATPase, partial [Alphaproteobacteria bacterium]|nr:AAA family ATPase [Alphaproteobacteria bacterium]